MSVTSPWRTAATRVFSTQLMPLRPNSSCVYMEMARSYVLSTWSCEHHAIQR